MDIASDFRSLLSNQDCSDELYRRRYAFKTVFYKSRYIGTYCCCPCGFDNEFLNYISEDGEIIKEIYDKILHSIHDGKCSHVDNVPREFVKETSVYGAHIAAAVGTPEVFEQFREKNLFLKTSIFHLDPFMVGISKKNFSNLAQIYELYINSFGNIHSNTYNPLFIARKSENSTCANAIKVDGTSIIAFCLKHESLLLFKHKLEVPGMTKLTEIVKYIRSNQQSEEIPREFLSFLLWFAEGKNIFEHNFSTFCCQAVSETVVATGHIKLVKQLLPMNFRALRGCIHLHEPHDTDYGASVYLGQAAIIFDQLGSLNAICGKNCNPDDFQMNHYSLGELCSVLQKRKCQRVLSKHGIHTPKPENIPLIKKINILYHVMDTVYNCDKQGIENLLKELTKIGKYDRSILQSYIKESWPIDIRIVRLLLELDARVVSVKAEKDTHLTDLLKRMRIWNFNGARAIVELLLSENFDWDSDKTVVVEGLKLDVDDERTRLSSTHAPDVHLDGEYITDSKLHCSFKNNAPETLPLEFYGPLLIECGFPYTKDLVL